MYLILFNVCCIGHGHNTAGGSDGCFRDGTDSEGQGARLDRAHRWRGTEDRQGRDQLQVRYIDLRAAAGGLRRLGLPRAGRRRCGDRAVRTYVRRRAPRVGLLLEKRANMGDEPVWCAIGGFVDPGESHDTAQTREAAEESGLDAAKAEELAGMATNANRAFFVADASVGEGVRAYGLSIPFDWLEADGESFKLKDAALIAGFKKADDMRLFPWRAAIGRSPDALARSAIAQLIAAVL